MLASDRWSNDEQIAALLLRRPDLADYAARLRLQEVVRNDLAARLTHSSKGDDWLSFCERIRGTAVVSDYQRLLDERFGL